jgi:hypothetical protein
MTIFGVDRCHKNADIESPLNIERGDDTDSGIEPNPITRWRQTTLFVANVELSLKMEQSRALPSVRSFIAISCVCGLILGFLFFQLDFFMNRRHSVPSHLNQIQDWGESNPMRFRVPHFGRF